MDTLLPTTKHRRGRRTPRQERALADPGGALIPVTTLASSEVVTGVRSLILDIGFGAGEAVVALAISDPGTDILAVDMHTPGIGDLLASIREQGVGNVYVVDADIRHALACIPPGRCTGVRTFFPDPWPKKRHHRRRLITTAFADALAGHVAPDGYWHIATDWAEYAEAIEEQVGASDAWRGGRIPRPNWRPETRYERRGRAAGRAPIDLWFERVLS
ncbi:MAG: hypothetical protein RL347_22 [Actinomycetota bacterium]